jgi:hypothetical protein
MRIGLRAGLVGLLVWIVAVAGCRTVDVTADWDPAVDFSALSTWAFAAQPMTPQGDPVLDGDSLFAQRARKAIAQQLDARGYRQVDDPAAADFRVAYFLVVQDRISVTTINDYYGYGPGWGWRYGYSPGWGFGPGGFGTQTYVDQYKEGTLVIDVSEGPDKRLVWRGAGSGRLRDPGTPAEAETRVQQAVREILAKFPPPEGD